MGEGLCLDRVRRPAGLTGGFDPRRRKAIGEHAHERLRAPPPKRGPRRGAVGRAPTARKRPTASAWAVFTNLSACATTPGRSVRLVSAALAATAAPSTARSFLV
jgi:hypothetical protein